MTMVRKTTAQAMVAYLAAQSVDFGEGETPFFAGAWAIFGHGNVAGLGEALHAAGDRLPTWRAHNEQAMAHAAIAYAKQMRRRRAMVCTSSIRSEEHTSELQSLMRISYAVFCLKNKNTHKTKTQHNKHTDTQDK